MKAIMLLLGFVFAFAVNATLLDDSTDITSSSYAITLTNGSVSTTSTSKSTTTTTTTTSSSTKVTKNKGNSEH